MSFEFTSTTDKWVKCISSSGTIRAVAISAVEVANQMRMRHRTTLAGTVAMTEATIAGLILSSYCKGGEKINLNIKGSGWCHQAIIDANADADTDTGAEAGADSGAATFADANARADPDPVTGSHQSISGHHAATRAGPSPIGRVVLHVPGGSSSRASPPSSRLLRWHSGEVGTGMGMGTGAGAGAEAGSGAGNP